MDYLTNTATLTLAVTGYAENDYCVFFGNLGSGAIDYETELSEKQDLYGQTSVVWVYDTQTPGTYDFGAKSYDEYANASAATENGSIYIDCEPVAPNPMTFYTYVPATDILTLVFN